MTRIKEDWADTSQPDVCDKVGSETKVSFDISFRGEEKGFSLSGFFFNVRKPIEFISKSESEVFNLVLIRDFLLEKIKGGRCLRFVGTSKVNRNGFFWGKLKAVFVTPLFCRIKGFLQFSAKLGDIGARNDNASVVGESRDEGVF